MHAGSSVYRQKRPLIACLTKEINMRKISIAALVAFSVLVSACNTVKGLGRDIESVGKSGSEAIN
jgi:predicted small secreted protein